MALTSDYWMPQDTHLHPSDLKDLPDDLRPQVQHVISADLIEDSDDVVLSESQKLALGFDNPTQRLRHKWAAEYLDAMIPQYSDEARVEIDKDNEMLNEDLDQYSALHQQNLEKIEQLHKEWEEMEEQEDEEEEEAEEKLELADKVQEAFYGEKDLAMPKQKAHTFEEKESMKDNKLKQLKESFKKAAKLRKLAKKAHKDKKSNKISSDKKRTKKLKSKVQDLQQQILALRSKMDEPVNPKKVMAQKPVVMKPKIPKKLFPVKQPKTKVPPLSTNGKHKIKARVVKAISKKRTNPNALEVLAKELGKKFILVKNRKKPEKKPEKKVGHLPPKIDQEVLVSFLLV